MKKKGGETMMKNMKRGTAALLALLLAVCMGFSSGSRSRAEETQLHLGQAMPDFTVTCADGSAFTLSEALKEKDLVLVNIWATWCGWCRVEFPMLEEAYQKYRDRVGVIALSIEENDTPEVIRDFASQYGLTFPMAPFAAPEQLKIVNDLGITFYPTSIVVDRFGNIAFMEAGCKPSAALFGTLFDSLLANDTAESILIRESPALPEGDLQILCMQNDFTPVEGVRVEVTAGEKSVSGASDRNGAFYYDGEPGAAPVCRISETPAGFQLLQEEPVDMDGTGTILIYVMEKAE